MDIVKAMINLKEGLIELEGPQEFVEKYLEIYRPDINKWQKAISTANNAKPEEKVIKRIRTVKPKGTPSCASRISTLIDEDFFKDSKTSLDVANWLKEQKGITYESKHIAAALFSLIKSGKLRRFKEGKNYKYCNP